MFTEMGEELDSLKCISVSRLLILVMALLSMLVILAVQCCWPGRDLSFSGLKYPDCQLQVTSPLVVSQPVGWAKFLSFSLQVLRITVVVSLVYRLGLLVKGKAILLQAWGGPEGSRKLRFPDLKTIGTWRWQGCQPFTPRKYSWYSFLLEAESSSSSKVS